MSKRLDIVWTSQFKKDYKQAMKRRLNVDLLVLTLSGTGTHSDLFG